jgi:hypothetical protein
MKLIGFWEKYDAPYIIATLILKHLQIEHEIKFLIDTGASKTIISDKDAVLIGIDYKKLDRAQSTLGIGGLVDTYILPNAKLVFKVKGGIFEEYMSEIFVIKHKVRDYKVVERIKNIPSLLGRDFLNKYILHLNKTKKEVLILG